MAENTNASLIGRWENAIAKHGKSSEDIPTSRTQFKDFKIKEVCEALQVDKNVYDHLKEDDKLQKLIEYADKNGIGLQHNPKEPKAKEEAQTADSIIIDSIMGLSKDKRNDFKGEMIKAKQAIIDAINNDHKAEFESLAKLKEEIATKQAEKTALEKTLSKYIKEREKLETEIKHIERRFNVIDKREDAAAAKQQQEKEQTPTTPKKQAKKQEKVIQVTANADEQAEVTTD